jgi:HD-GYP domain-containing protein (c-di-GMP phosphodiesterase class II)
MDAYEVETGVAALAHAVDAHDRETGRHSASVAAMAARVGRRIGMRGGRLGLLVAAARLHDLGKVAIPEEILNKPGPLEESEWMLMRRHPGIGADVIACIDGLGPVAPLVRSHHERWDGRGYPDGLAGEEIPLASRVIAACDSLQAMTSDRPYRGALTLDDALAELIAGAGSQFDPDVVTALTEEHRTDGDARRLAHARR